MNREESKKIVLDLDYERILEVVGLSYDTVVDVIGVAPYKSRELLLAEASAQIHNGVTLPFMLELTSKRMNDFFLRVDPRKKMVLGLSPRFPTLRARINGLLRLL
jgi:hypothetical protein